MSAWPVVPALAELPGRPKRIILHWTAGGPKASDFEQRHYHYLIERDGTVVEGVPVARNMRQIGKDLNYAAHTRGMNSYSVGVAFCGMWHAVQGETDGPYPLTESQVEAGCRFVGHLCRTWGIVVTGDTVFTHPEAERIHRVKQNAKWDLDRLPWRPDDTPEGNAQWLRSRIWHHANVDAAAA